MSPKGAEEKELKRSERRQLRADPESLCSASGTVQSMLKKTVRLLAWLSPSVFIGGVSAPEDLSLQTLHSGPSVTSYCCWQRWRISRGKSPTPLRTKTVFWRRVFKSCSMTSLWWKETTQMCRSLRTEAILHPCFWGHSFLLSYSTDYIPTKHSTLSESLPSAYKYTQIAH